MDKPSKIPIYNNLSDEEFDAEMEKGYDDFKNGNVISKQDLMNRRKWALNNAVASVEMEGYVLSETEKQLCMDVLNVKMTKDEFIKQILEICGK